MADQPVSVKRLPVLDPLDRHPGRLCWECAHISYFSAQPNYSDETPGSAMTLECGKWYWEFDPFDDLASLRDCLTTAERCADFEEPSK